MNTEDLVVDSTSRKKAWTIVIIRTILGLALIYGIFLETGICTALFAFLVLVALEIHGILMKKVLRDSFGFFTLVSMLIGQHSFNPFHEDDADGDREG